MVTSRLNSETKTSSRPISVSAAPANLAGGQRKQFLGNPIGPGQAVLGELDVQNSPPIQRQRRGPEHQIDGGVVAGPRQFAGEQFHAEANFADGQLDPVFVGVPRAGAKHEGIPTGNRLFTVDGAVEAGATDDQNDFHEVVIVQGDVAIQHRHEGANGRMAGQEKVTAQQTNWRGQRMHVGSIAHDAFDVNIVLINIFAWIFGAILI